MKKNASSATEGADSSASRIGRLEAEKLQFDILLREQELKEKLSNRRREWSKVATIVLAAIGTLITWHRSIDENKTARREAAEQREQNRIDMVLRQNERLLDIARLISDGKPDVRLIGAHALLGYAKHANESIKKEAVSLAAHFLERESDNKTLSLLASVVASDGNDGANLIARALQSRVPSGGAPAPAIVEVLSEQLAHSLDGVKDCRIDLSHTTIAKVVFRNLKCAPDGVSFKGSHLRNVEFRDATLHNVDFRHSVLHSVAFANVNLVKARFADSTMIDCTFAACHMRGIKMDTVAKIENAGVDLTNASLDELERRGLLSAPASRPDPAPLTMHSHVAGH